MNQIPSTRTALVAGSTGLIGSFLIDKLLRDDAFTKVIALSRYPLNIQHEHLKNLVIDYDDLEAYEDELIADDFFCALGTTMAKSKNRENFRKVDHDYPIVLARLAERRKAKNFLLVSSIGADHRSPIFYTRVKGETENAIKNFSQISGIHIFRPSLLLGRTEEKRLGENIGLALNSLFSPVLVGKLEKYKGIEGATVAQAMIHIARNSPKGIFTYESDVIQKLVK